MHEGQDELARYAYEEDGLKVESVWQDAAAPGGTKTRRYLWEGRELLESRAGEAGPVLARPIRGVGRSVLANLSDPDGEGTSALHQIHEDRLGSVVAETDASGEIVHAQTFDPHGKTRNESGESTLQLAFTGHERDDVTGLLYMKARWYDPDLGVFLSEDPQSYDPADPFTTAEYVYANLNPPTYVDPFGEEAEKSDQGSTDFVCDDACEKEVKEFVGNPLITNAMSGDQVACIANAMMQGRSGTDCGVAVKKAEDSEEFESKDAASDVDTLKRLRENLRNQAIAACKISFCDETTQEAIATISKASPSHFSNDKEREEHYREQREALSALGAAAAESVAVGAIFKIANRFLKVIRRLAKKRISFDGVKVNEKGAPVLHKGRQDKHVRESNNFESDGTRSILTHKDPQNLLDDFAGRGEAANPMPPGTPGYKERVEFGEVIGYFRDDKGNLVPTTKGIIHYGKDGAHIVPARP